MQMKDILQYNKYFDDNQSFTESILTVRSDEWWRCDSVAKTIATKIFVESQSLLIRKTSKNLK
jgi:hypothetical protein